MLRVIFNYGDNYFGNNTSLLSTYFPPILSGLISFLIAYYIFSRGKKKEKESEDEKLKELEGYFYAFFDPLNESIDLQVLYLVKFSHILKEKNNENYSLIIVSSLRIQRILDINEIDLFRIFILGKDGDNNVKNKHFRNLQNQLVLISEIIKRINENFNMFISKVEIYKNDYKNALMGLSQIYDQIYHMTKNQNPDFTGDIFFNKYMKIDSEIITKKRNSLEGNDMKIFHKEFLIPASELCISHITDIRAINIKKHLDNCIVAYDYYMKNSYYYRRYFIKTARVLNQAKIKLNQELTYLKNMKPKQNK